MNEQQRILVQRLQEAGVSTKRFLKVGYPNCPVDKDKAAFEDKWQEHLYGPEDLDSFPRWGINGGEYLVLIDSDHPRMYEELSRALPKTFEVTSPRRGLPHKYFVVPDKRNLKVQNAHLHFPDILGENGKPKSIGEIRAQNNYLVAPGTIIRYYDKETGEPKTGQYTITQDIPITTIEYDEFMKAVQPFIGAISTAQKVTLEDIEGGIPEGERTTKLFKYACKLASIGLSQKLIVDALKVTAARCIPPFDDFAELERMAENALKYKPEWEEKRKQHEEGKQLIEKSGASPQTEKPITLPELKEAFKKWLYIGADEEVIDVILASALDRKIKGDPLWMVLISPSGGTKTELVRSLTNEDIYTLDSVTPHTFISGRVDKDEDGNPQPVIGILKAIDGKVLVIKDFTVLLGKRREDRDEIFSQLRSLYDGYIEFGFGTSPEPVRIDATIGLIVACTPAIDTFTKMYLQLGERFLKIRHHPDPKQATHKALQNLGKEEQMRTELTSAASRFLKNINCNNEITISEKYSQLIEEIALTVAILRTPVPINFWKFEINDAAQPVTEYPTRLAKQLTKLAYGLAIVRGKTKVTKDEIRTVKRVACDTCVPNRVLIIKEMSKAPDKQFTTTSLAKAAKIPLATCWRELKEMEYLAIVEYEKSEKQTNDYGPTKHTPESDGWNLLNRELSNILDTTEILDEPQENPLFTNVPPTYTDKNKIASNGREDAGEKKPIFKWSKMAPSSAAAKCECGNYAIEVCVKPPQGDTLYRCPSCFNKLRLTFNAAKWTEEASQ